MELERKSEATEPGTVVDVETTSTAVLDDAAADEAVKVILQNNGDEDMTIRMAADGATGDHTTGFVLGPGGHWEEDRYAGAWCAAHHGASGTQPLTVIIV